MSRLRPRSLFGQILVLLLGGFLVSQAVGWWLYSADRAQAVRAVSGFAAAERVANAARLMREAPADWRDRLASAMSDETFRVRVTAGPVELPPSQDAAAAQVIAAYLADQLPGERGFRVSVAPTAPQSGFGPRFGPGRMAGHGPMMHGLGAYRDLQVALPLAEGRWLAVATGLPDTGPAFSSQFLVSMAAMGLITLGVAGWAARRVTAPLAALARAAERLGSDVSAPALPEAGSNEMRQASKAFNAMQASLRAFIDNRTGLLAAISHDLRTPLTLLRLRAEALEATPDRERLLVTVGEMESMIGATLDFARGTAITEPRRPTDLPALLRSAVDDMADAGLPVTMDAAQPVVIECRPSALKRALVNLLENAVKYGGAARAAITIEPGATVVCVDDPGPGIPERELERVFEPFFRLDPSRSRDSGGVGLGLAIARAIVIAEGGSLALSNLPGGGLRARLTLPRDGRPAR